MKKTSYYTLPIKNRKSKVMLDNGMLCEVLMERPAYKHSVCLWPMAFPVVFSSVNKRAIYQLCL